MFYLKIKALQELPQNSRASDKKYPSSFLVHHCRNLKSGICTISFLLRSLYMFITVYNSFHIIPIFIFLNSHPGCRPSADTRGGGGLRPPPPRVAWKIFSFQFLAWQDLAIYLVIITRQLTFFFSSNRICQFTRTLN